MKKFIITLIVLAILGGGGYYGYNYYFADKNVDDGEKIHVESVSELMGEGAIGTSNVYTGMIEPQKEESVEKDDSNKISKINVKEGDQVKKGDVLFEYDVEDIQLQLESANLEYESEEAEITTLNSTLEKLNTQLEKAKEDEKLEITLEIQTTELEIKKKEYELVTKKTEIAGIEKKLKQSEVTSPIDGIIKSIKSENDNSYSYGGEEEGFITIYSLGNYRVKGSVSEINRRNLYEGQTLKIISRLDSGDTWYAVVSEIADKQDSNNNNFYSSKYTFYAELDNIDGLILGQHVYMSTDLEEKTEREGVWIPSYYICEDEDGSQYVYSAMDGKPLQKVAVETGDTDAEEELTEILSGLTKADYIAFPSDDIKEGMIATTEAVADMANAEMDDSFSDYDEDFVDDNEDTFDDTDVEEDGEEYYDDDGELVFPDYSEDNDEEQVFVGEAVG